MRLVIIVVLQPRLSFRIIWFRLFRFRSPLLSESRLFSFPPGTEMVHFPGFALHPMYSEDGNRCSHRLGFPIRTSPDHSLLASPRSFSQLTTSFFACLRQGIHTHALSSLTIKSILNTEYFLLALLTYLAGTLYARQYSVFKDRKLSDVQLFSCQNSRLHSTETICADC